MAEICHIQILQSHMSQSLLKVLVKKSSKKPQANKHKQAIQIIQKSRFNQEQFGKQKVEQLGKQKANDSAAHHFLNVEHRKEDRIDFLKQKLKQQRKKRSILPKSEQERFPVSKNILRVKRKKQTKKEIHNLSLIQESQRQQDWTSSSNNTIQRSQTSQNSFNSKSLQSNMDESFEDQFQDQLDFMDSQQGQLNKTMVKMHRKQPKNHLRIQEISLHQNQLIKIAQKYPLESIFEFFKQGKMRETDYLQIIQIKKNVSKRSKQLKFQDNMQKIQKRASIIQRNYQTIQEILTKDIEDNAKKIQEQKKVLQQVRNPGKVEKTYKKLKKSQKLKAQIEIIQETAGVKAKISLLSLLKKQVNQFETNYKGNLMKLSSQMKSKQNYCQNLIFRPIKQFLQAKHQSYQHIMMLLQQPSCQGQSYLQYKCQSFYFQSMEEKFSKQLQLYGKVIKQKTELQARRMLQQKEEMTQQIFELVKSNVQKESKQNLINLRFSLQEMVEWIRMIRIKGELKLGKCLQEALNLTGLTNINQIQLQDYNERIFIQQFKFFRNKITKKLESKSLYLERLSQYLQSQKTNKNISNRQKNRNKIKTICESLQGKTNLIQKILICFSPNMWFFPSLKLKNATPNGQAQTCSKLVAWIKNKIKVLSQLENKAQKVIEDQNVHRNQEKKRLIPTNQVLILKLTSKYLNSSNQDFKIKNKKHQDHITVYQEVSGEDETNYQTKNQFSSTDVSKGNQSYQPSDINLFNLRGNLQQQQFRPLQVMQNFNNIYQNQRKQNQEQLSEQQKKSHIQKAYALVLKYGIQIQKTYSVQQQVYIPPNITEFLQMNLDLNYYQENKNKSHQNNFYVDLSSQCQDLFQFKTSNRDAEKPFKKTQNVDIQRACQLFARSFVYNPNIYNQLGQKQFYFLMSPQYRNFVLQKKQNDEKLVQRILTQIRRNMLPLGYGEKDLNINPNPVRYMMQVDPHFQMKIDEYQHKIVLNQRQIDPLQGRFRYGPQTGEDDYERYKKKDLLERRLEQVQTRRTFQHFRDKNTQLNSKEPQLNLDDFYFN